MAEPTHASRPAAAAAPPTTPPTWAQRVRAMRNLPPFLRMVWQTHRGYVAGIALLRLLRAFVPIASLWVGKLIVDAVVEASRGGVPDWRRIGGLVAVEFGIVALGEVAARTGTLLESLLGDLFSNRMSVRLMEHAAELDLQHFEDPVFYDRLERARRQTVGRIALLSQLFGLAQDAMTLLTLIGTLLAFSPVLFALLVLAVLPSFLGETHFAALGYSLLYQWTPERRKLDYYRLVAASEKTAKEVKLFGLAPYLIDQYRTLADRFYLANRRLAIRRNLVSTGLSLLSTLGYYAAYATIVYRTVLGRLTLGDLTLLSGTFSRSRDLIQRMLLSTTELYEQALYLDDLFVFFSMRPSIARPRDALPFPRPIRAGFEFRDVWFRYPEPVDGAAPPADAPDDDPSWVLRGISLPHPTRRAAGAGGRERRGQDDHHQAAGAAVRAHARHGAAGRTSPGGVRPCGAARGGGRHLPGLRALRHDGGGEHRRGAHRGAGAGGRGGAPARRGRGGAVAGVARWWRRCRSDTGRCWDGASRGAWTFPAASGRRWPLAAPTCATPSSSSWTSPRRRWTRARSSRSFAASRSSRRPRWPS